MRLPRWILIACLCVPPVQAAQPQVVWKWTPAGTYEVHGPLTHTGRTDGVHLKVTGRDPVMVFPAAQFSAHPLDILEITLDSTRAGVCEWFWRYDTEGPYGGFSSERSATVQVQVGRNTVTLRPLWEGKPITGLRFDPIELGGGEYVIRSVRVLRGALTTRTPAALAVSSDGWVDQSGRLIFLRNGSLTARGAGAALVSPPVELQAADTGWIAVDLDVRTARTASTVATLELRGGTATAATGSLTFTAPAGQRVRCYLRVSDRAGWSGTLQWVSVQAMSPVHTLTLHEIRTATRLADLEATDIRKGVVQLVQADQLRSEGRLPVSPQRIDIATQDPPETRIVQSDFTVGMWYFAAWEPEYTWDGWRQIAERSPWRMPLLYDSADPSMEFSGIRYYRSSHPRAVAWHVHWMREHGVNLMVWDWYVQKAADGRTDATFFGNRALEQAFLGKEVLGGPPVSSNPYADKIAFCTMWTNHAPGNELPSDLAEYMATQFFLQPNYYCIDGKPLLPLWSVGDLIQKAGSEEAARQYLQRIQDVARAHGLPGVWIAAVNGPYDSAQFARLGVTGAMAYNVMMRGGHRVESRQIGDRPVRDFIEHFPTQTVPGHVVLWDEMRRAVDRNTLVATMPMQNWEPTWRPDNYITQDATPDAYRSLLLQARSYIEQHGLRRFVTVEAFNEWLEGSYVEPSTQWGLGWLEAIRDVFAKP